MEQHDDWACCSLKNKDEIKFFVQVGFGLIVVAFSIFQIIQDDSDKNVWISLLSGTLGLFLPNPSMAK